MTSCCSWHSHPANVNGIYCGTWTASVSVAGEWWLGVEWAEAVDWQCHFCWCYRDLGAQQWDSAGMPFPDKFRQHNAGTRRKRNVHAMVLFACLHRALECPGEHVLQQMCMYCWRAHTYALHIFYPLQFVNSLFLRPSSKGCVNIGTLSWPVSIWLFVRWVLVVGSRGIFPIEESACLCMTNCAGLCCGSGECLYCAQGGARAANLQNPEQDCAAVRSERWHLPGRLLCGWRCPSPWRHLLQGLLSCLTLLQKIQKKFVRLF